MVPLFTNVATMTSLPESAGSNVSPRSTDVAVKLGGYTIQGKRALRSRRSSSAEVELEAQGGWERQRDMDDDDDVIVAAAAYDEEYHGMAVGLRHHGSSAAVIGIGFLTQEIVVRRFAE